MTKLMRVLLKLIDRWRGDQRGNVAILFGLAMLPATALVGASVDYTRASMVRSVLLAAADSAAIGSIAKVSNGYSAAVQMSTDGSVSAGQKQALDIFSAETAGRTGFANKSVTATVVKANWQVTSTVTFSADVPTVVLGVIGINSVNVGGTAVAVNGLPTYIDFYLLLDNTPSMGVAASSADITTMVNNTPDQCAFACHDVSNPNNYYNLAKKLGVTTRIDVLRSATQQLMDTANNTAYVPGQFRMGIYTFGTQAKATQTLNTVSNLTTPTNAKSLAANIDLMTVSGQNQFSDQDTQFDNILPAVGTTIPNPGNGQGAGAPQKVLLFVSDGVADEPNPPGGCSQPLASGGRCQEPLNVALCTTIKNRGIRIAVLYTTYLPLPTNSWYMTYVDPFNKNGASKISQNMQACASPGLFFEVSPSQGISAAMTALFVKAIATARLVQ